MYEYSNAANDGTALQTPGSAIASDGDVRERCSDRIGLEWIGAAHLAVSLWQSSSLRSYALASASESR